MTATHPDASRDLMSCSQVKNRTPVKHADCAYGSSRRCTERRERHSEGRVTQSEISADQDEVSLPPHMPNMMTNASNVACSNPAGRNTRQISAHVVHVGAGIGCHSAILAEIVGRAGRVTRSRSTIFQG